MATFAGRQTVRATHEAVAHAVGDLPGAIGWDPSIRSVEPAHIDNTWNVVHGFYGRPIEVTYCISERSPERISFAGKGRRLRIERTFELQTDGFGSTTIDYRFAVQLSGPMRLLDRGLKAALEGVGARTLEQLAEHLGDTVAAD